MPCFFPGPFTKKVFGVTYKWERKSGVAGKNISGNGTFPD
jgi:hypothetical protein